MNTKKSVFGKMDGIWEAIKDISLILKPCRFSIILLIAILAFFILADQGQDVLRALTEQENTSYSRVIWFYLALFLWAINTCTGPGLCSDLILISMINTQQTVIL